MVNAQDLSVTGMIVDENHQPMQDCSVALYTSQDSLHIFKRTTTDIYGKFELNNLQSDDYKLEISFVGYSKYATNIALRQSENINPITLYKESQTIEDVVITVKMVNRFADHKEYRLTDLDKEQYSSALSALEFLPKINVIDQNIYSVDGKTVKVLINGVPSTPTDLSVISPLNISRIDYYTQPSVQYSNIGLGAVVNVITKKNVSGGTVGINTQNAVTTGFGNNTVNFKYNFWNSLK